MALARCETAFYDLSELESVWAVEPHRIERWIVDGMLRCHVWLPVMSVFKEQDESGLILKHWEGFAALNRHQCQRLFRRGRIGLRRFSSELEGACYILPDTAEDVFVTPTDLVVLDSEKQRFETQNSGIVAGGSSQQKPLASYSQQSFRRIYWNGEIVQFGPVQAACLYLLWQAEQSGQAWCNGKQLLSEAGSASLSLGNLFKRKRVWRELVTSDERGSYRLSEGFCEELKKNSKFSG